MSGSNGIKFIPDDQNVTLLGQKEWEAKVIDLLKCTIEGLHRVEKQLEKLTDEEIDQDETKL
jgi:hypothetical protein